MPRTIGRFNPAQAQDLTRQSMDCMSCNMLLHGTGMLSMLRDVPLRLRQRYEVRRVDQEYEPVNVALITVQEPEPALRGWLRLVIGQLLVWEAAFFGLGPLGCEQLDAAVETKNPEYITPLLQTIYYGRVDPGAEGPEHSSYPCPHETIHWLVQELPRWFGYYRDLKAKWKTPTAALSAYSVGRLMKAADRRISDTPLPHPNGSHMNAAAPLPPIGEEEPNQMPDRELSLQEMVELLPRVTAGGLHGTGQGRRFPNATQLPTGFPLPSVENLDAVFAKFGFYDGALRRAVVPQKSFPTRSLLRAPLRRVQLKPSDCARFSALCIDDESDESDDRRVLKSVAPHRGHGVGPPPRPPPSSNEATSPCLGPTTPPPGSSPPSLAPRSLLKCPKRGGELYRRLISYLGRVGEDLMASAIDLPLAPVRFLALPTQPVSTFKYSLSYSVSI
ncbi:hypothetical protein FA13DRAFT_1712356 [Coprinellus micaceus]|uniref:Uncharacterized protein n=1 Tax=Coprinellus micaceus TaxID=71717 RepID=A0A4Y7T0G4_COPMI|nr:hypothetical protein FA13DRAFT_1712356 [Coprinellus micaceus]